MRVFDYKKKKVNEIFGQRASLKACFATLGGTIETDKCQKGRGKKNELFVRNKEREKPRR